MGVGGVDSIKVGEAPDSFGVATEEVAAGAAAGAWPVAAGVITSDGVMADGRRGESAGEILEGALIRGVDQRSVTRFFS